MNRRMFPILVLTLFAAGCAQPPEAPPTPDPGGLATNVAATLTALATPATETAPPPTAAPTDTAAPAPADLIWLCHTCGGTTVWQLSASGASRIDVPITIGQYYGYSPASQRILYASTFADSGAGPGNIAVSDLWIYDFAGGQADAVIDADVVVEALWGPDGQAITYIQATSTTYELRWRSAAGEDRLLASDVTFTWSLSPDGNRIAFTRESGYELAIEPGLYVVSIDSGDIVKVTDLDKAGTGSIDDRPAWSPDGRWILFSNYAGQGQRMVLAASDGSSSVDITYDTALSGEAWFNQPLSAVLWLPDGRRLVGMPPISEEMGGPSPVILYEIDPDTGRILSGIPFGEAAQLIAWDILGKSVWVMDQAGTPVSLALP